MNIHKFFKDVQEDEEYDYKVLIYGNYTYRDNLEADSLVEVLRRVIPFMSQRWKIHFTILIPEFVKSLNFHNVEQRIYTLPTYINQMRTHFNSTEFMKIIDWKRNDWDLIYSNLPEHTNQIANCIYNNTNLSPKIIGYSHWFEVPENAPYPKNMLDSSVAGLLQMEECGVNSKWLKELTLKHVSKHYNEDTIRKLEKIIQPHYLGVDRINPRKISDYNDKTVIFNHRDAGYTGWDLFVNAMDELWETRKDFKVYTTLAQVDRHWNQKVSMRSRDEYMEFLSKMKFGVGTFQTYSAWSVSVTDGLSVGVPYLLPNKFCYPEMMSVEKTPYPYFYEDMNDFKVKFEEMLDTPISYDTTNLAKHMLWDERIAEWFNGWDKVFTFHKMKNTDVLKSIVKFIKNGKVVTKEDILKYLGWGVRIKWSDYRHALRDNPNIRFTKKGYEWKT